MFTSLEAYVESRKRKQDFSYEELVDCILNWHSEFGELDEKDYAYLEDSWELSREEVDFLVTKEFNFD